MRIGLLEIIIVVIVVIATLILTRIARSKPDNNKEASARTKHGPKNIWGYAKRLGIVLFIAGILFALTGMSIFRWAVQGYLWALILMALGLVTLLVSIKK